MLFVLMNAFSIFTGFKRNIILSLPVSFKNCTRNLDPMLLLAQSRHRFMLIGLYQLNQCCSTRLFSIASLPLAMNLTGVYFFFFFLNTVFLLIGPYGTKTCSLAYSLHNVSSIHSHFSWHHTVPYFSPSTNLSSDLII